MIRAQLTKPEPCISGGANGFQFPPESRKYTPMFHFTLSVIKSSLAQKKNLALKMLIKICLQKHTPTCCCCSGSSSVVCCVGSETSVALFSLNWVFSAFTAASTRLSYSSTTYILYFRRKTFARHHRVHRSFTCRKVGLPHSLRQLLRNKCLFKV